MYRLYIRKPTSELRVPWNSYEPPIAHVRIEDRSRWSLYRHTVHLRHADGALDAMLIVRNRPARSAAYRDNDYLEHVVLPRAAAALDAAIASVLDQVPPNGNAWIVTERGIRGPPKIIARRLITSFPRETSLSAVVDVLLAQRSLPYDSIAVMTYQHD
jgi:hypothetical protein